MWDLSGPVAYALTIGDIPYNDSGAFEGQAVIPAMLNPHQEPVDTPQLQVAPGQYLLVFHPIDDATPHYFTVTASGASAVPAAPGGTTEHDDGQSLGTGTIAGLGLAAVIGLGLAVLAGRRFVRGRRTSPA
jgi:hypothetical protein